MAFVLYPHPAVNVAIFKQRLSTDMAADNSTYTLQCSKVTPVSQGLTNSEVCASASLVYNSQVDLLAAGAIEGEVDGYLYDRLDLANLPIDTTQPFVKGLATSVLDLLPVMNARWKTNFQPEDLVPVQLPVCSCGDDPIGVTLQANPDSLLYIGQRTFYVVDSFDVVQAFPNVFLGPLSLPALTLYP